MKTLNIKRPTLVGLIAIILSTVFFVLPELIEIKESYNMLNGTILIHFSIAILYTIYAKVENLNSKIKFFKHNRETGTLTGVLFWISCFALNRDLPIFHQSVNWLSLLIVICTFTLLIEVVLKITNQYLKIIHAFLSGLTSILLLYYTLYLMPFWGVGLIGMILIGIGGHVFVPFLMLLNQIKLVKTLYKNHKTAIAYTLGFSLPVITIVLFSIVFSSAHYDFQQTVLKAKNQTKLPTWVYISQHTPKSTLNSLILRKALVYPYFFWDFMDDIPNSRIREEKKHNPALVISDMLSPNQKTQDNISINERTNILLADYEEHNEEEKRLWRGNNLSTTKIKTEVELFPKYRISYTEKTFWIKNTNKYDINNQQEAIYTFHMPEGTVVTSLSLWVNGREQKGKLTSKKKAEKAYNTIVGKERRDPSLVTWKEGNMITVRVFPCTPSEERQVKIGFSSPMPVKNNNLYYQALQFEGPTLKKTKEHITIHNAQNFSPIAIDFEEKANLLHYNGDYKKHWNLHCSTPLLSTESFCFQNNCYTVHPSTYKKVTVKRIYLDLNDDWSKSEVKKLLDVSNERALYYFKNEDLKTIKENSDIDDAITYGNSLRFSLFPFHKIDVNNSLVITQGGSYSAKWSQLGNFSFEKSIRKWVREGNSANIVLIGSQLTPYQKGLLEFKALNLIQHSIDETCNSLKNKTLTIPTNNSDAVNIYQSELSIRKTLKKDGNNFNNAPNHLMRLYAYNYIMANAIKISDKDSKNLAPLINLAQTAYVVSPVSSLIVLESQKDYDDHNISDKTESLKNASISSSGAAPEPHEWMMIIMALSVVLYTVIKNRTAYQILPLKKYNPKYDSQR